MTKMVYTGTYIGDVYCISNEDDLERIVSAVVTELVNELKYKLADVERTNTVVVKLELFER